MLDIGIIGGGIAGLTAAIYSARGGKKVCVFEPKNVGGQIIYAKEIENYPGITHISGIELCSNLKKQLEKFQIPIIKENAERIYDEGEYKIVTTDKGRYEFKTLIIAVGTKKREANIAGESKFVGKGISYCALCDGGFFKNMPVCVVGGGNNAIDEALYLSEICSKVYLVHRRNYLSAEKILVGRIKEKSNIIPMLNYTVESVYGDDTVRGIQLKNCNNGKFEYLSVNALFAAIGYIPDNKIFSNLVELDKNGFIITDINCRTKTNNIYAIGDCRSKTVRQLTTAVSDGTVAADSIIRKHTKIFVY